MYRVEMLSKVVMLFLQEKVFLQSQVAIVMDSYGTLGRVRKGRGCNVHC